MARIRTIKPEFWTSEQVMDCEPLARLLFIGIWNFCDDAGNHPLSEKSLKALVFPGDSFDSTTIRRLIDDLSANGLLSIYDHSGKQYLHVNGWHHQKIEKPTVKHPPFVPGAQENREKNEGMRPATPIVADHSPTIRREVDDPSTPEGIGKGMDITPPRAHDFTAANKFAMHSEWQPGEETFAAVLTMNGMAGQILSHDLLQEFKSFWIATPDEHRTQAKWEHALAQHLKREYRNDQATSGQRTKIGNRADRQGPLSAVDRVNRAISEKYAARAATGSPVAENDGALRPPLDVEFWRER